MLDVVGKTTDGKNVIGGVAQFRATFGLPFDYLFDILKEHNSIPDFHRLMIEAPKPKEVLLAAIDVYGKECGQAIEEWLLV